jgi:CBS domain containing-hemolysin-like protein
MSVLLLVLLLLLIAVNGFFVAAEFALVRSRSTGSTNRSPPARSA